MPVINRYNSVVITGVSDAGRVRVDGDTERALGRPRDTERARGRPRDTERARDRESPRRCRERLRARTRRDTAGSGARRGGVRAWLSSIGAGTKAP